METGKVPPGPATGKAQIDCSGQIHDMHELQSPENCLQGTCEVLPGAPGCFFADRLEVGGMVLHVDDVVLRGREAGMIIACLLDENGTLKILVEEMVHVGDVASMAWQFRHTTARTCWVACEVALAHAWRAEDGGIYTVLRL